MCVFIEKNNQRNQLSAKLNVPVSKTGDAVDGVDIPGDDEGDHGKRNWISVMLSLLKILIVIINIFNESMLSHIVVC